MFGVLIADDEYSIRNGLKDIISWEEYGMEIIGEASNGAEAVDIIIEKRPKIVITDIKMPVMDGIEFIKEIRKRNLDVRVIVLSGYDDFCFVKEAMKYGAENYLLKPVDENELAASLKEISVDLEKGLLAAIRYNENMSILKNNTLNRIIKNEISYKEYIQKAEFLSIDLSCGRMRVAVIEPYFFENERYIDANNENPWRQFAVLNICEEIVSSDKSGIAFLDNEMHVVIVFNNSNTIQSKEEIKELLSKCTESIKKYMKFDSFVAVGIEVNSYKSLSSSYMQAVKGLDYKLVLGINNVLFYEDVINSRDEKLVTLDIQLDLIKTCFRTFDHECLSDYINSIFNDVIESGNICPDFIRSVTAEIIITVNNVIRELKYDTALLIGDFRTLDWIWKADSIESLRNRTLNIITEVSDHIHSLQNRKYSKPISEMCMYIENNFGEPDISLKTLSHKMQVNAAHLGRMFKNETGDYFTDYLNKIRVEKAKELLLDANVKVNEVSEKVGFLNTSYFCAIFKKLVNINPKDFRSKQI